jgi:hypothetical protein
MSFKPQNDLGTIEYANSLVTLEYFNNYFADIGTVYSQADSLKETSLVKATRYINTAYLYKGTKRYQNQGTEFPRDNLTDRYGNIVDFIPLEVKADVCEIAGWLLDNPTLSLYVNNDPNIANIQSEKKKVAELEKQVVYFGNKDTSYEIGSANNIVSSGYLTYEEGRIYI